MKIELAPLLQEYHNSLKSLRERITFISQRLSEVDEDIVNIYHIMENVNLNAVQFTKIAYQLKTVLLERRDLKEEFSMLQSIDLEERLMKFSKQRKVSSDRLLRHKKESEDNLKKYF